MGARRDPSRRQELEALLFLEAQGVLREERRRLQGAVQIDQQARDDAAEERGAVHAREVPRQQPAPGEFGHRGLRQLVRVQVGGRLPVDHHQRAADLIDGDMWPDNIVIRIGYRTYALEQFLLEEK